MKRSKKKMIKIKKSQPAGKIPSSYKPFLEDVKKRIRATQIKSAIAVNTNLIKLYWSIGKDLAEKQKKDGWGTNLIERFANDLQKEFPNLEGFSRSNIFYMRSLYLSYEKVQQVVGQFDELPIFNIPWGHNIMLLTKLKDSGQRLWYAQQTIENGWSRVMLETWIESDLFKRQGKVLNNFKKTLPPSQSDLALQIVKDPYCFDILTILPKAREEELEKALVDNIQALLLELGQGFAFIGRQYPIEIEDVCYKLDLLFYHTKLHCYIVIELKMTEFKPEYAGKMQFYLTVVDRTVKSESDNPTIGLILCKKRKKLTVEYVLQDVKKPIGVSEYLIKVTESLPKKLKRSLPSVQELEEELQPKKDEN